MDSNTSKIAIVLHGGASNDPDEKRSKKCSQECLKIAKKGYEILKKGGSALDVTHTTAIMLENNPYFNAGTGSALNRDGDVEMDASIMDGKTLRSGCVAILRGFKNPVSVARKILTESKHVLLGGEGARRFAQEYGFEPIPTNLLITERALKDWENDKKLGWPEKSGTIGSIALDKNRNVAAATSTGGLSGKYVGRVGDSALLGCGNYADNRKGACSATGHGESIIKVVMAKYACDLLKYEKNTQKVAEKAVEELKYINGTAGLILLSVYGDIGIAFNSSYMIRAWVDTNGQAGCAFE